MAKLTILILFCQIITLPILKGQTNGLNLEDFVSSYMEQYGDSAANGVPGLLNNLVGAMTQGNTGKDLASNLMSAFLQGDGAKNLGAMLGQDGDGGGGAGNILAGLGSLLGGQNGQIDPSLVGNMISMFSQSMTPQQPKVERKKRSQNEDNDINLESILSLASGFLGNKNSESVLPMVMNVISAFSGNEAQKKVEEHKEHATFLPPFLEKAHLYWDLFINSELGKTVWEKSGLKRAFKAFTGPDGKISFDLLIKSFENQQFRRHWIKAAAQYLTDMVIHVAKPEVYQKYLTSAQYLINGYLDAQGLPKSTQFNVKRPEKSITALVNHALKRYLDMDTDVSDYVKPAVDYIKQTIKMAQTTSQKLTNREDYNAIADRVTDTLNLDVIEPVLRVYRAYKHSVEAPHCQEHLLCLVNKGVDQNKTGVAGFKAGLTKISSLAASAALSFQNGKGFWDLYNAIQSNVNCEAAYPADCASFHEHELKVTTEPYHSEL